MDALTVSVNVGLLTLFALIVGLIIRTSAEGTHVLVSEGMKSVKEASDTRAATMQTSIDFNAADTDRLRKRVVFIEDENANLKLLQAKTLDDVLERNRKIADLTLIVTAAETAAALRDKAFAKLSADLLLQAEKTTALERLSGAKDDVIAGLSTKLDTANRQLVVVNSQLTRVIQQNDHAAQPLDHTEANAAFASNTIIDAHAADPMHDPAMQPDVTNMLGQFNMTATIKDAVLTPTNASEMLVGSADLPDAQRGITPQREGSAL